MALRSSSTTLLLVGVVLMAAVAVKALGPKIGQAATNTEGML